MDRKRRLQSAKSWIATYNGSNLIKGYRRWFGVDLQCAIQELRIVGVKLDEQYITQALKSQAQLILLRKQKIEEKKQRELQELYPDSDDVFYFIAGYTSCGCPYGKKWVKIKIFLRLYQIYHHSMLQLLFPFKPLGNN